VKNFQAEAAKEKEEADLATYLENAKAAEVNSEIDDEIFEIKEQMQAVKARGREKTLAGESDAGIYVLPVSS
jgi:hypothetical protein